MPQELREVRMALIRIEAGDNYEVDYDPSRGMYIVSVFEDGHFTHEVRFDAYEEMELPERDYCNCQRTEDMDEYYGYWIECECGFKSNTNGADYCGGCGKRIRVTGYMKKFKHFGER